MREDYNDEYVQVFIIVVVYGNENKNNIKDFFFHFRTR